jgi:hypothetical protein
MKKALCQTRISNYLKKNVVMVSFIIFIIKSIFLFTCDLRNPGYFNYLCSSELILNTTKKVYVHVYSLKHAQFDNLDS